MTEKSSDGRVIPNRRSESATDQSHCPTGNVTPQVPHNRFAISLRVVRALVYCYLHGKQRADALELPRLAERLAAPPPHIAYGTNPDLAERWCSARTPRPDDYPG
jgi:hypothetical protein